MAGYTELVATFCSVWKGRYREDYHFTPRDGKHVKWLLAELGLEKATQAARKFIASDDNFLIRSRHSLGMLVSGFREFTVGLPDPLFDTTQGLTDDEIIEEFKKMEQNA